MARAQFLRHELEYVLRMMVVKSEVQVGTAALLVAWLATGSAFGQTLTEPLAPPQSSSAETEQRVKYLMRQGVVESSKDNLEAAREAFEKAWQLKRHPAIAVSLAEVEMKLGRYREAAEHWDYALDHIPPDRAQDRAEVEQQLAECRKRLGRLRVTVDTPGAEVTVGTRIVGRAPLGKDVWVDPGVYTVLAQLKDHQPGSTTVTLQPGERRTVALVLDSPPAPVRAAVETNTLPPPSPNVDRDGAGMQPRTLVVIGGSVMTATALAVAVGYTLKAYAAEDERERIGRTVNEKGDPALRESNGVCGPAATMPPAECSDLQAKADERDRAVDVARGAFIAAGVLGVATISTLLLWPDKAPTDHDQARFAIRPLPVARGQGVQVKLRF